MVQYYIFESVVQLKLLTETKTAFFEKHHRLSEYGNYNILTNTHIWVISCEHLDSHTSMCQSVSVESQYMRASVYYLLGNSKAAAHVVCRPSVLVHCKAWKG